MDPVPLAPVVPGRSALPAFLPLEAALAEQRDASRRGAEARLLAAREEAARIRQDGEARLKDVLVEAQARAWKEAEARARDRVSGVRARTERWVDQAEEAAGQALADALGLCCRE